jgi:hypothetical protein
VHLGWDRAPASARDVAGRHRDDAPSPFGGKDDFPTSSEDSSGRWQIT